MALRENELARRNGTGSAALELSASPIRARWSFDGLIAADGNTLRCTFACSVRPLPDRTERQALAEVLMGPRPVLTVDEVVSHFAPTLRAAADDNAKSKGAAAWLSAGASDDIVQALKKVAASIAFSCGLEVLAPYQVELESPTYQQQRVRDMQRTLTEKEAAGQVEHFARAAELLRKFQELRQAAPELSVGRILEQISPTDRGQMLQTLLLASAKRDSATELWAVAGPYLVKIDPRRSPPHAALHPLPPTLGPLRSVQPAVIRGQRVLLVGARGGFMVVRPGTSDEPDIYADPAVQSQLGFSRVIFQEPDSSATGAFVACHGDAGIVRWTEGRFDAPTSTLRPDRFAAGPASSSTGSFASRIPGPRNLQPLGDKCIDFSVGNRMWIVNADVPTALQPLSESEIISVIPDAGRQLILHEDGTLCTLDTATHELHCHQRRAGRYRSAGALPWLGGTRALLASEDGAVDCVGIDDLLVTQYLSPHRDLRAITGSADIVVGVSSDRQRLVLWNAWDGKQPLAEIYLTGLTRHRIADVEFG